VTQIKYIIKINGCIKTGGPLAMLQLASKLKKFESDVILCFDSENAEKVFSDWVEDLSLNSHHITVEDLHNYEKHCLIVTETDLNSLKGLNWKGQILCYMLSIDNCIALGLKRLSFEASIRHLKNIYLSIIKRSHIPWVSLTEKVDLFLSQSHYANQVLSLSSNKPVFYIGDYIEAAKLSYKKKDIDYKNTRLKVCYNPKKGVWYFRLSKFFNRRIDFVPIKNLNEIELIELFQNSHAYVDFGSQPGKDRLPREAIGCGCPSFIMSSGAGINFSDFPRSSLFRFKISQLLFLHTIIKNGIKNSFSNHNLNVVRAMEVSVEEQEFEIRVLELNRILNLQ
jgi:hypothetical protein